jgi:hypothetical protein
MPKADYRPRQMAGPSSLGELIMKKFALTFKTYADWSNWLMLGLVAWNLGFAVWNFLERNWVPMYLQLGVAVIVFALQATLVLWRRRQAFYWAEELEWWDAHIERLIELRAQCELDEHIEQTELLLSRAREARTSAELLAQRYPLPQEVAA